MHVVCFACTLVSSEFPSFDALSGLGPCRVSFISLIRFVVKPNWDVTPLI